MPTPTVSQILAWLKAKGSKSARDGMARYGIVAPKAFGMSVGTMRAYAKIIGRDHGLALALWRTGWYEARMLACMIDDPKLVTPAQMDRWCRDFDSWAICDTACFVLFDKSPHAWGRVKAWATRKDEFEKRASFALIASLAGHDKTAPDTPFMTSLKLIDRAATDERNFVKKGVSWALRGTGMRSKALHAAALELAEKLAKSESSSARWIGNDARRDLSRPLVLRRVAKKDKARKA